MGIYSFNIKLKHNTLKSTYTYTYTYITYTYITHTYTYIR